MGVEARDTSDAAIKASQRRMAAFLRRYHPLFRERVRDFARSTARRLDLAVVFPAATIVLVTAARGRAASEAALALVDRGAPLKDVARILDVPMWLRRLPPEAFARQIAGMPDGEAFARQIASCSPRSRAVSADWISNVAYAAATAGHDFAVWIARQPIHSETLREVPPLRALAAFAWYSTRNGLPAQALMSTRWRPDHSFETALCAAKIWFNRIRLMTQFGHTPIADGWLEAGTSEQMHIEPLLSADALLAEARAMGNCIDQYAKRLAADRCRLFSIRTAAGEPVGNIEIAQHPRESGYLTIHQLKSRHNAPAPAALWRAAHGWLAKQASLRRDLPVIPRQPQLDRACWITLLQPFVDAAGPGAHIPLSPTPVLLDSLEAELDELARRGHVRSWLFA